MKEIREILRAAINKRRGILGENPVNDPRPEIFNFEF